MKSLQPTALEAIRDKPARRHDRGACHPRRARGSVSEGSLLRRPQDAHAPDGERLQIPAARESRAPGRDLTKSTIAVVEYQIPGAVVALAAGAFSGDVRNAVQRMVPPLAWGDRRARNRADRAFDVPRHVFDDQVDAGPNGRWPAMTMNSNCRPPDTFHSRRKDHSFASGPPCGGAWTDCRDGARVHLSSSVSVERPKILPEIRKRRTALPRNLLKPWARNHRIFRPQAVIQIAIPLECRYAATQQTWTRERFRVAPPAADPPDNNLNDALGRRSRAVRRTVIG